MICFVVCFGFVCLFVLFCFVFVWTFTHKNNTDVSVNNKILKWIETVTLIVDILQIRGWIDFWFHITARFKTAHFCVHGLLALCNVLFYFFFLLPRFEKFLSHQINYNICWNKNNVSMQVLCIMWDWLILFLYSKIHFYCFIRYMKIFKPAAIVSQSRTHSGVKFHLYT